MKPGADPEAEEEHYLRRLALAADPDRALAAGFAPPDAAACLWAVILFEAELRRATRLVSTPLAGAIRLQWRREWIEALPHSDTGSAAGRAAVGRVPPDLAGLAGLFGTLPEAKSAALALIACYENRLEPVELPGDQAFAGAIRDLAEARLALCAAALGCPGWQPGHRLLSLAGAGVGLEWLHDARQARHRPAHELLPPADGAGGDAGEPASNDIRHLATLLIAEAQRARAERDPSAVPAALLPALAPLALIPLRLRSLARDDGAQRIRPLFPLRSRFILLRVMLSGRV